MPVDRRVVGKQLVAVVGRPHVPALLGVVEKRRVAAPAVGISVFVLLGTEQASACVKRLDNIRIRLLYEAACEWLDPLVEGAVELDRVLDRQPILLAELEVVLAERDGR